MAESGVIGYTEAVCVVRVFFPKNSTGKADIRCSMCEFWRHTSNRCGLNNAVTEYPTKYVGSRCPLEFDEEVYE